MLISAFIILDQGKIETPSTRPYSSTSEYSSPSQSDEENSVIQPNLVKQKIAEIEAGQGGHHRDNEDEKHETQLDQEIERLNLGETSQNPLERSESPSSFRDEKSTTVYSESEVDLPSALEDGHSEDEEQERVIEGNLQRKATSDAKSKDEPEKTRTSQATEGGSNDRTDRTSVSHATDTRSTGRSDWTSTGTGSYTGTGSFATSYYSDEETEPTLATGVRIYLWRPISI